MTEETQPVVRGILYPAQVTLPDGQVLRRVKLALTTERVYVWTGVEELAYSTPYTDADVPTSLAPRSARWTVTTEEGVLTAQRMSGCGCGVALKTWQPFRPERWATV